MSTEVEVTDYRLQLDCNVIHVHGKDDDYEVWLNTDIADYDGLCIGCGQTEQQAVRDALTMLEQGIRKLRESRR